MTIEAVELFDGTVVPREQFGDLVEILRSNPTGFKGISWTHLSNGVKSFGKHWSVWIEAEQKWVCHRIGAGAYGDSYPWLNEEIKGGGLKPFTR